MDECVEDCKEDERDGEGLEQSDEQKTQPAEMLIAQAAPIRFLTKDHSEQRATGHRDEHLCIERQRN